MAKAKRSGTGKQEKLSVSAVQEAVSKSGATWEAGPTTLTAVAATEWPDFLGLVVTKEELAATAAAIKAVTQLDAVRLAISAPAAIDWRNNGGNFITPIKNQNPCGSCVSFGTIATIESRMNIACRTPGTARDYAEAFLFYCGCGNCCGTGWNFVPALDFCKNTGVAQETAFPYTPANQPCKPGVVPAFKINGHTSVLSMADRKSAIADRGPVVAGMAVYQDFFAYRTGVYRHISGGLAGYHCVSVIGYDDAQSCWIAKNSWGTGWGEAGFFRIAYGDSGIDSQFAFYEPQVSCAPSPVGDCERYLPVLKRVILLARTNAVLRRCLLQMCRGVRPLCPPQYQVIVNAVAAILRRCPRYRLPFCRAIG
jgi:C1A family cysteine protease